MSFVLCADCDVVYEGRASSVLARGIYVILHKDDGSLLIHGGDKSIPRNYQPPGGKIVLSDNKIISKRKNETIVITVYNTIFKHEINDWSRNELCIRKTEKELVKKIIRDHKLLFNKNFEEVHEEYKTELGPIDIVGIDETSIKHIVEVKRKNVTLANCSQLKRYMEIFDESAIGYIASPSIGKRADKYLKENGLKWVYVDFD